MLIGELSRRTGISRRSLRYYEQHGLLHARRGANGWRIYDESAVERVRAIADLIGNGLTLEGAKRLAPCLDVHDPSDCENPELPVEIYGARLAVVDQRLAELQHDRDQLARQLHTLHSTRTPLVG